MSIWHLLVDRDERVRGFGRHRLGAHGWGGPTSITDAPDVDTNEARDAARTLGRGVDTVLVWRRHPGRSVPQGPMLDERDFVVDEVIDAYLGKVVEPDSVPAAAPPFGMSTSKGCQHATGGSLAFVRGPSTYFQDIQPRRHVPERRGHRWDYGTLPHRRRPPAARDVRSTTAHAPSRDACRRPSDATECGTVGEVRPVQPTDSKGCGAFRPASAPRAPAGARAVIRSGDATRIRTG